MTQKSKYTTVSMHEFKAKMCEYMRRLNAGEAEYIIKRYGRPVACVLNIPMMELTQEADKARREMKRYQNTLKRHEEQRRVIRARLLSWPGHAVRNRLLAAEEARRAKLYYETFGKY